MLPDSDPIRVWANFEFIAQSGAVYEVDALIVTSAGVFLVEIKSHPGEISGDAGTWKWTRPDTSFSMFDNPRLLANRKAKHLADLIARTDAYRRAKTRSPYVQEVVFLSDPDLRVSLAPQGRYQVFGRDSEDAEQEIPPQRKSIDRIVDSITRLEPGRDNRPVRRIDRPTGELIARAIEEIGIRERTGRRRVGDYRLGDLLLDVESDRDTGIAYQDFLATHASLKDVRRRIRIYPLEHNATTEARETAARAAKREFSLIHQLDHPGILRPLDYTETERGPALIFDHDPAEVPLYRWLEAQDVKDTLTVPDRLNLTRAIAEALQSAHQRGVTHRALSPSAVFVSGPADAPRVRITNWHTGARVASGDASTTCTTGTIHIEALAAHDAGFYRAPEFAQPHARPIPLDIFSLGALATLVFTGRPPAETPAAYNQMLVETGHIPADVIGDGLDPNVVDVIAEATAADPADRFESIADFLAGLDLTEEQWHQELGPAEPAPDDARRGDTLGGGRFEVRHRLGRGSTALALEVHDADQDSRSAVLKIAIDPSHNPRLEAEAQAISQLVHRNIVRLLDGPIDISGHTALLLSHAGSTTLASRMADQPLAELAERFGEDLLEAVRHLEQQGVSHRDIKPENIGVTKMGKNDELHLVLFDFSLATAPLEQIGAGTQGYIDPFLKSKGRQAWDQHAERYSAAVTLFEMLTGSRPTYGDGSADPAMTDALLMIERSMFEQTIAPGLVDFFTRALAREVSSRFDTADDMLRAWKRAFAPASQPATPTDHPTELGDGGEGLILPARITRETALAGLPLSNRTVNALEREEVLSVDDLLVFPLSRLPQIRGVGAKTRREITDAVVALRALFSPGGEEKGGGEPAIESTTDSLVAIADGLMPKTRRQDQATRTQVLTALLGLDGDHPHWPTQADLANAAGVTPARVSQIVTDVRSRWVRQRAVSGVRDWIAGELLSLGGIATLDQLAQRLQNARPEPGVESSELLTAATAVVRAALVAEEEREHRRWVIRRRGGATIFAYEPDDRLSVAGQSLADYAGALADATEFLVAHQVVASRRELLDTLIAIEPPGGAIPIPDTHLADLATALTPTAAVNTRLELYRAGMPVIDALSFARRAFVAVERITPLGIAEKLRSRFPKAEALPGRPDLDRLIKSVGLDLTWSEEEQAYLAPLAETTGTSSPTTFKRHTTGAPTDLTPVEIDVAADFETRLERSIDSGGLLVLVSEPKRLEDAAHQLERLPVTMLDFDELLLDHLVALTSEGKPSWELLTAADAAGPGTAEWNNLTKVVLRALDRLTGDLMGTTGTVVLHRLGLLARYNRLDHVSLWRDRLHQKSGHLRSLWLLVGTPHASQMPAIDGKAVPVLTPNEWARLPREWLENAHRAGVVS
jgi:serine/threonine protein kinase